MEKIIEVTYYGDNDSHSEDEYWINKQNVNLFINGELEKTFIDSIHERENFKKCMEYIEKNYPNAKCIDNGTLVTGWDFITFKQ